MFMVVETTQPDASQWCVHNLTENQNDVIKQDLIDILKATQGFRESNVCDDELQNLLTELAAVGIPETIIMLTLTTRPR